MGILKKIWNWFFEKKEVETMEEYRARKIKEAFEKKHSRGQTSTYNNGGYIKNTERYVAPRYSETISSSTNDNFLTGAMVGYVITDSLSDNTSHRIVEETKSSSYESSYTPNSSSSYGSGSYSSSSDSGSSSSCSCDSGC